MDKPIIKTKLLLLVCAIFVSSLALVSCKDSEEEQAAMEAKLTDFSPESARRGSMLTLNGENLGASLKNVRVWINDTEIEVINVTHTKINIRVPDKVGSGQIKVSIKSKEYIYPSQFSYVPEYLVSNFAGTGDQAIADGPLAEAKFTRITDMVYDPIDDVIFTLESDNNPNQRIRRIKDGEVKTLATFKTGQTTLLNNPRSLEFSITGDTLFVANDNAGNQTNNPQGVAILKRSEDFSTVHPYLTYPAAEMNNINYIAVNPIDGTLVYYCYSGGVYAWNAVEQKANQLDNIISTIKEISPTVSGSEGTIRFAPDGKTLYIVLARNYSGILSAEYNIEHQSVALPFRKFVGNGRAGAKDGYRIDATMFNSMQCIFGPDNNMFVAEGGNNCVRRVTPEGNVTLFAGTLTEGNANGVAEQATFFLPRSIISDKNGVLYVSEYRRDGATGMGNRIRKIEPDIY